MHFTAFRNSSIEKLIWMEEVNFFCATLFDAKFDLTCFMFHASLGSCLLLAAKFNDDMKREKIKELIEVILLF